MSRSPSKRQSLLLVEQIGFVIAILASCWVLMMALHELGHVFGAVITQGTVQRVVLHPLTISRTDVFPNPNPAVVVWFGPVMGCLLPISGWLVLPRTMGFARKLAMFFAGFCLVANGAYISIGSIEGIGDCKVILQTGSPVWALILFGVVSMIAGFVIWHKLGSFGDFVKHRPPIERRHGYAIWCALIIIVTVEFVLAPI